MEKKSYIKELLIKFAAADRDTFAFSVKNGVESRDVTFVEFTRDVLTAAGYFTRNNMKGTHVAIVCEADYWFYVAYFSIIASGNVAVLMNPALPPEMLDWQCKKADVTAVYCPAAVLEDLKAEIEAETWIQKDMFRDAESISMEEVCEVDPDDTICLVFTSGTTGKSKAVEITSRNLQASVESCDVMYEVPDIDPAYHAVPRYHIAGLKCAVTCLAHLDPITIGKGMRYVFQDIVAFNPSFVFMVPAMLSSFVRILKKLPDRKAWEKYTGKNLKRISVGGAALNPELARDVMALGFSLETSYGMTETTGAATWCMMDEKRLNTIGKVVGDAQMRVCNGELQIKASNVMKGYYKDPQETANVLDDGWIRTGDIGYCDDEGYFYISGRLKNIIILANGENVCPEEIEEKLYSCSDVTECMVYSDGKGICADIFTAKKEVVEEYVERYNEGVPMYRQVYKVNYSEEPLEKTGSGKIKRKESKYV